MADTYNFPVKTIPDHKKDEEWHRKYILAIMSQTLGGGWFSIATSNIDENYNIYNSLDSGEEFNFLQESEDGESLPAIWLNYNTIRKRIHTMIGELISQGLEIDVKSVNKDAVTRKMEAKKKVFAKMRMKQYNMELAEMSGIELADEEFLPRSIEELETYFRSKYKENTEIIMQFALNYAIEFYKWKYKRIASFRDLLIAGRCFCKAEMRNGYPNMRRIDPRYVVFDPYSNDDFLSDAAYFGEIRYMTFEDAAEQYNVSEEEIKELYYDSHKGLIKLYWQGALSVGAGFQTFLPFTEINGGARVLCFSAEWLDYKTVRYKRSVDKHGNEHFKMLSDKEKGGKDVVEKVIATVRQATLVGGHILKEWGEAKNITRDLDNPSVTRLNYISLLPNYVNYRAVSKLDEMKGLQKLKDIAMYRVQLEMTTAGRKGFAYDLSLQPEGMPMERVMYYLKTAGIAFYDSGREGLPHQGNPFTEFDNSITSAVQTYIAISQYLDQQMDSVSGIEAARYGEVAGASQAVGVTSNAVVQSSTTTMVYYELFRQFEERLFQRYADLVKIAWRADKDKFAPIIGEAGIDWLKADMDVDLDDYAVFIKSMPNIYKDKSLLENMVMGALQSQQLTFADAIVLLTDDDIKAATQKFLAIQDRKAQADAEAQMAMQEAAMQTEIQSQQAKTQGELALIDAQNQGKIAERQMKDQTDLQKTAMKNQASAQNNELNAEKDLLMKEIDRQST